MARLRLVARLGALCVGALFIPVVAMAQAGIAGVVRDSSGGVMPGVTVEAASPALIEKVRSVVTDAQGLYSIVNLRPGVYSVTFTLPGFSTVKRDGIGLTGSFTATVNAELTVGALEETVTVTGEAANVDTRNVVQQRVMTDAVRETLPTGRNTLAMAELIPGITATGSGSPTGHDVVGVGGNRGAAMIHGSRRDDYAFQLEGAPSTLGGVPSTQSWQADPAEVQEFVFEVGAISAETSGGGVRANVIPKEGGNRFTGYGFGAFTNDGLMANNITQKLIDVGILTPNTVKKSWDANFAGGGPIKRDRLWFFTSTRNWGRDDQIAGMYFAINPRSYVFDPTRGAAGNVDLNKPGYMRERNRSYGARFTWQATTKNKLSGYFSNQPRFLDGVGTTGTGAYEASQLMNTTPNRMTHGTWKSPITSKLLFEAMVSDTLMTGPRNETDIIGHWQKYAERIIGINDVGTGFTYRARSGGSDRPKWVHDSMKSSVSYVTGSHAAKVGVQYEWGKSEFGMTQHTGDMHYVFRNGAPIQIIVYNEPYYPSENWRRVGLYVQDQWTIKRFTVNGGLRFDGHNGFIPDNQTSGPNAYAPFQTWPAVKDVPNWKDLSPRFGVVHDVFGTGKTAIKFTLNRYINVEGITFSQSLNPVRLNNSATRPWTDRNGDFIPQESELGTLSNSAFGTSRTTTRVDDTIREGWGVRQYNWETSASVQHQVIPPLSVNFGFTRRWFRNFTVTDNVALTPADYDEYCLTAPTDTRLGDVSGSRICGLYDLNPAKRTVIPDNLRTDAKHYGTQKETWQGIDVFLNARLPGRVLVQGGVNSGTEGNDNVTCFIVDSPEALRFCDAKRPWRNNVKMLSSFELPWGVTAAATFQRIPMPEILANYTVTSAQVGSVVQFVKPARTSFGGGSATVNLIEPGTRFQPPLNQVDIRLAKAFRFRGARARFSLDIGNLLNASVVQVHSNTYGTSWLRPTYILQGRVMKPGFLLEF